MLTTTVCAALSAAGLAVAFLTAFRRRYAAATRIAAFALLPIGLAMTGLLGLGGEIGKAVGSWAGDLVFKPSVWAGFGALAVAVVLFVVGRFAARRGVARGARQESRGTGAGQQPTAASGASTPALANSSGQQPASDKAASGSGEEEDFSDIEAILKKHGI